MSSDIPYTLLEKIGTGGMGTVYRARDELLGREVAVKLLHGALLAQPDQRRRFLREAMALARCGHPNVVGIYGCSAPGATTPFLVIELVAGSTLRDSLSATGRFPWEAALAIVERTLRGLQCIHENGLVHRDIKPENILLTSSGVPKIADFGIARILEATAITGRNEGLGTLRYMPPEMFQDGVASPLGDIYSMGCVLYELIAGHPPFHQESIPDLLHKVIEGAYVPLGRPGQDIMPGVAEIVDKAMNRKPDLRYADALSMRQAVSAPLRRVGIADTEGLLESWAQAQDRPAWIETVRQREKEWLRERERLARLQGTTTEQFVDVEGLLRLDMDHPAIDELTGGSSNRERSLPPGLELADAASADREPATQDPSGCSGVADTPVGARTGEPRDATSTEHATGQPAGGETAGAPISALRTRVRSIEIAIGISGAVVLFMLGLAGAILGPILVTFAIQSLALSLGAHLAPCPRESTDDRACTWFAQGLSSCWLAMLLLPDLCTMNSNALVPAMLAWSFFAVPWARSLPHRPALPLGVLVGTLLSGILMAPSVLVTLCVLVQLETLGWFVVLVMVILVASGLLAARHLVRRCRGEEGLLWRRSFLGPVMLIPALTVFFLAAVGLTNEEAIQKALEKIPLAPVPGARLMAMSGLEISEKRVVTMGGGRAAPDEVVEALASIETWGSGFDVDPGSAPASTSAAGFSPAAEVGKFCERVRSLPRKRVVLVRPMARPSRMTLEEYARWRRQSLTGWAKSLGATHLELPSRAAILNFAEVDQTTDDWDSLLAAEASALRPNLPGVALGVTVTVSSFRWRKDRAAFGYVKRIAGQRWIDWIALRLLAPPLPSDLDSWIADLERSGLKDKVWLLTSPGVTGTGRVAYSKRQDLLWMELVRRVVDRGGLTTWAHYPLSAYDSNPRAAFGAFAPSPHAAAPSR